MAGDVKRLFLQDSMEFQESSTQQDYYFESTTAAE